MSETPSQPLFYGQPEPLSSERHRNWRLTNGDYAFAAATPSVPILVSEFAAAARDYPIVFAQGSSAPIAVLGLEPANLFVNDGHWTEGCYIPAYVRRYPFGFIQAPEPDRFVLGVDILSTRLSENGAEGLPLFDGDQPSPITRDMLAFCETFQADAAQTSRFCEALNAHDLLIDRRADATLPNGRQLGVDGFSVIDTDKFATLDTATIVDWHRNGWLPLIHFHLFSLGRFTDLLARQSARAPEARTSETLADVA